MVSISLLRVYVGKGRYISLYNDSIILEYHSNFQVVNAKLLVTFKSRDGILNRILSNGFTST